MFRDGAPLPRRAYAGPPGRGPIDPAALTRALSRGATLVLNAVQDFQPAVAELARRLERRFSAPVSVNVHAGWRGPWGAAERRDDQDVFILQIDGPKRWKVCQDTAPHPIAGRTGTARVPAPQAWEGVATPGDVLYIPRGWRHAAQPGGEPCMHLAVALTRSTGVDLLQWLSNTLKDSGAFRRDLPGPEDRAALRARVRELREEALRLWTDAAGEDYWEWANGLVAAVPASAPPVAGLPPGGSIRLRVPRAIGLKPSPGGGGVRLRAAGRTFRYPDGAADALRTLLSGEPVAVDELLARRADGFPEDELRRILEELVAEGVAGAV